MFSGHTRTLIIPSLCTMTIIKWRVTTFFNFLNLNYVWDFRIKMWNLNFKLEFRIWILNLNFQFDSDTFGCLGFDFEFKF